MANAKEKEIRHEFQMQQRADLLSLHRTLCEKERIALEADNPEQIGRVAILKKRIAKLLKRCAMSYATTQPRKSAERI